METLLDNAIDMRYQKNPEGTDGVLVYISRIDVGGMIRDLNELFFNYEHVHYEFFDIEMVGWRKHKAEGHVYFIYYIEFQRMRYTKQKRRELSKTS